MSFVIHRPGQLVRLKEGWYFCVKHDQESRSAERRIFPRAYIDKGEQGLILEHQGNKEDNQCWHILVDGKVLIAWDDNFKGMKK
jgi:hypothetical protein